LKLVDDPESTTLILVYFIALTLAWVFSRTERTVTVRSQAMLERLLEQSRPIGYKLLVRTTSKRRVILAIGIGDLVAQFALIIAAFQTAQEYANQGHFPSVIAYALAVLASLLPLAWIHFIVPSTKATEDIPSKWVKVGAPVFMVWTLICWPLVWPIDRLLVHNARQPEGREAREEALLALVEDDSEEGIIEAEKREMISSIINIDDTTVKDVMVPRVDIVAIEHNRTVSELLALLSDTQHSRVPIYEDRVDNVVGIVHAKDVLQAVYADHEGELADVAVDRFSHEGAVLFVPTTKKIDELLRELRREKKHMAIAVDEYGGTAGIVTMEDILEEIVGEIQDEYDSEDETPYRWLNETSVEVDAAMDIADVNELIGSDLPEENGYDTLGGFLYQQFSAVPESGAVTRYGRFRLVVQNVDAQRIDKVLIEKLGDTASTRHDSDNA
jgi:putative hemolysin